MVQESRLSDGREREEEQGEEQVLRPHYLKEYIGQAETKEELLVYIKAAQARKESLDHVLLCLLYTSPSPRD